MNRKSVGIITIHKSLVSYGASLQAYALWNYIDLLGYNCEIIDLYRPVIKGYIEDTSSLTFLTLEKTLGANKLIYLIKQVVLGFVRKKKSGYAFLKSKRFESFNANINYSRPYKSIADLYKKPPEYDYYISGSDQIWNPDMPFENEPYLLSFVPKYKNIISYASSFGRNNLPDRYKIYYRQFLRNYKSISVREESGRFIVEELLGEKPFVALDPTMLFDLSHWKTLVVQPKIKNKYLFCYSLNNNNELIRYAIEICKNHGLSLVIISDDKLLDNNINIINASDSGPMEWLGLIQNSDYVITDSFHGTVFSILFQKQFYSYVKKDNAEGNCGTRLESLLNQLSLENRLINNLNIDKDINNESIEYININKNVDMLRRASKEYLKKALS